jgi:hypothetical protein
MEQLSQQFRSETQDCKATQVPEYGESTRNLIPDHGTVAVVRKKVDRKTGTGARLQVTSALALYILFRKRRFSRLIRGPSESEHAGPKPEEGHRKG